ncbi:MAG: hypothetical protein HQL96_12750 [Magnetococcales bacterium]|nr:hypothetical protein [Magnetococcales bacterium]
MNVSIGMTLQAGAWGGGNRFGKALADHLMANGHQVSFDLRSRELDIILLAEPDRTRKISAYDHADILRYLLFKNHRALVVHRINNTSEARDDPEKRFNRYRIRANRVADHTVFVSQWVHDRYREAGFGDRPVTVILNGADADTWRCSPKARDARLRLVTHHWSTNPNKGIDLYLQLDALLATPPWNERLTFTYIGNLPPGTEFRHARHVPPLSGQPLVEELCRHDIYLTASRCEAGPNHLLEGALCGLPLLYPDSGSMPEYAAGFGLEYTSDTLAATLTRMLDEFPAWQERIRAFPHTAERMCQNYTALFAALLANRPDIIAARRHWRSPLWLARTLLRAGGQS